MRLETKGEISAKLAEFNYLSECVIEEIRWLELNLTIEVVFNYVYDLHGNARSNMNELQLVFLRFVLVQEFHFTAGLNSSMLSHPERTNWGLNEVATVRLVNDPAYLKSYTSESTTFHHVTIAWESERRIDVVFAQLEVRDG